MNFTDELAPIFGRRSIRKYTEAKVPDNLIRALLQAAMAAPSARGLDPWRFVVATDKSVLQQLAEGLRNGPFLADASLGMVVCGDQGVANSGELSYMLQDCTAAIEHMLIAAHILRLGACWLGIHPREDRIAHLRKILGLPDSITPICAISIGYPAEEKEARTRYAEEYVHWQGW